MGISSTTKMLSSTTTENEVKQKRTINDGKKHMAALKIMDSKMNGCFLKGSLQTESIGKFKNILEAIQSFYKIELPNLKFCVDNCYPRTKCVQRKQEQPNQQELVGQLQIFFCFVNLDIQNNAVDELKRYLLNNA